MTALPIEAGLRGAAISLFGLLAISLLRERRLTWFDRITLVCDLCAIAYLVESAPGLRDSDAIWLAPIRLLSMATPAMFLLWTDAAFNDAVAPRRRDLAPVAGMVALALVAIAVDDWRIWRAAQAAALLLAAAGIARVLAGRAVDLIETRRRARLAFSLGIGAWIAVVTLLGALHLPSVPAVTGVLGLAAAAALLRLRIICPAPPIPAPPPAPRPAPAATEDLALQARLRQLMEHDRLYREGGLTVAGLASRLAVPEHRLRLLINQQLGHRNFTSYVNAHRLGEAKAALADPAQARVPVLTIALDAGFQSIGPFNRAFKAETGETPTEYRRRHLAG